MPPGIDPLSETNLDLTPEGGLGTDSKAGGGPLPATLPDAPHLCDAGHLGGGEHKLGGPDAGAQEPGGDPGKI